MATAAVRPEVVISCTHKHTHKYTHTLFHEVNLKRSRGSRDVENEELVAMSTVVPVSQALHPSNYMICREHVKSSSNFILSSFHRKYSSRMYNETRILHLEQAFCTLFLDTNVVSQIQVLCFHSNEKSPRKS